MRYLIGAVEVDAVKSAGGGFYDMTVVKTGDKHSYLAEVFEQEAIPMGACKTHWTPHPKNGDCKDWNQV